MVLKEGLANPPYKMPVKFMKIDSFGTNLKSFIPAILHLSK
jgi:hypothetical protein